MTDDVVLFHRAGGVASLTLNRPEQGNAMSLKLMAALSRAVSDAEADPDCHVVVIRGAGRVFCGGGDLRDLARAATDPELQRRMVTTLQDTMFAIASSRLVFVSAVQGAAAGAGLGLVLNTDVVVASTRARFLGAYGAIGLSPDAGVSELLPLAVGRARASAMLLSGLTLDAERAAHWGLVHEVVEPERLDAHVDELAARMVAGATQALGPTKRLLGTATLAGYRGQLDAEAASITRMSTHPDTQHRIQTLLQK
jgi:2-(1,2-epoxy-1,2-dihydrophenyl)acetyl-CoA isomerase